MARGKNAEPKPIVVSSKKQALQERIGRIEAMVESEEDPKRKRELESLVEKFSKQLEAM